MKHPHAVLLEKLYADFNQGNLASALTACAPTMTFQVAGKSPLAGKYTRDTFSQSFVGQLKELSGGSFKMEVHDILASDRHAVVLASQTLIRDGKEVLFRTAHIWRFEDGLPVAGYEYTRDLYQYDAAWNS